MKFLFVLAIVMIPRISFCQLATYTPFNADFSDSVTIIFDLQWTKTRPSNLDSDTLYLWSWPVYASAVSSVSSIISGNETTIPLKVGMLTKVEANRWEISIRPYSVFEIPSGDSLIAIGVMAINAKKSFNTDPVLLKPGNVRQLDEVTVLSKKRLVEQQIGKTILNVQGDLSAAGSSAFEILQKAPGLAVTGADAINMAGKSGVNVLIDNRPVNMSGRELADFLRSLPGNSIDKIEIISNPSSRFDAHGNAGIINIRLKRIRMQGTNGDVLAGYTFREHYASSLSFNINHRIKKVNLFASSAFNKNLQHTDGFINRNVTVGNINKQFLNKTVDIDRNFQYNVRSGADIFISKKSTAGFLFNTNRNSTPFQTPGVTRILSGGMLDSSLITSNDNDYKNRRTNLNVNYRFSDTLGNELLVESDYLHFRNTNQNSVFTSHLDKLNRQYDASALFQDSYTNIRLLSLRLDYDRSIKSINAKIETGIKMGSVAANNDLQVSSMVSNNRVPDTSRTNRFLYDEFVAATYISFSQKINKIEYQIGIRAEKSDVRGNSIDLKGRQISVPDTSYLNFFPTAFIAYQLNEKSHFGLSFSRRINRPEYQSLNPFETIFDIYTSEKGNPYLKPQYSNNAELKFTYKYAMNVSVGYTHTRDYSQFISRQQGDRTFSTNENVGTLANTYLSVGAPMNFKPWWDGYISLTGFHNRYLGFLPQGRLDVRVFGMNYYVQQNFRIGKGWSMQLSSWFNSATKQAVEFNRSIGSLDYTVRKSMMKDRASLRVTFLDMLNTQRWEQRVMFADLNYTYRRKWESRGVRLEFNWSFGNGKNHLRERAENTDAERIKLRE